MRELARHPPRIRYLTILSFSFTSSSSEDSTVSDVSSMKSSVEGIGGKGRVNFVVEFEEGLAPERLNAEILISYLVPGINASII